MSQRKEDSLIPFDEITELITPSFYNIHKDIKEEVQQNRHL